MPHNNIAAWTPIEYPPPYPPYISINEQADGSVSVTLRECVGNDGQQAHATVVVTPQIIFDLAVDIIKYFFGRFLLTPAQ